MLVTTLFPAEWSRSNIKKRGRVLIRVLPVEYAREAAQRTIRVPRPHLFVHIVAHLHDADAQSKHCLSPSPLILIGGIEAMVAVHISTRNNRCPTTRSCV